MTVVLLVALGLFMYNTRNLNKVKTPGDSDLSAQKETYNQLSLNHDNLFPFDSSGRF